ncbi:unnamed protein product [Larinioides sclopetarius]|uniref:Uncharacterized protein n=1 Tax=Larinioides sclopetarius TaxID=280406 RepID=A0AAV1ZNU8_9ARAC
MIWMNDKKKDNNQKFHAHQLCRLCVCVGALLNTYLENQVKVQ